jgi:hypothetical protein
MDFLSKIGIFALVFVALSLSASAWHCTDTDQTQPSWNGHGYGPWGDNGLLGGNTSGWLNSGPLPQGCTGSWDNAKCSDFCSGKTLTEFYCNDRPGHPGETIIVAHNYEQSTQCGSHEVPEFTTIGAIVLLAGIGLFVYIKRK